MSAIIVFTAFSDGFRREKQPSMFRDEYANLLRQINIRRSLRELGESPNSSVIVSTLLRHFGGLLWVFSSCQADYVDSSWNLTTKKSIAPPIAQPYGGQI